MREVKSVILVHQFINQVYQELNFSFLLHLRQKMNEKAIGFTSCSHTDLMPTEGS